MKINKPFSVTYTISFSGRTQADGVKTVTSGMIRDKLLGVLEEALRTAHITEYTVSAELNNIEEKKRLKKQTKKGLGEVKSK